jgi:hypothetical protein
MGEGYIFGEKPPQDTPPIILESLYFNHNFKSDAKIKCGCIPPICTDAIDIRMNYNEPVEVPEWKKGRKRKYPATYIMNSQVVVMAEFSAEKGITSATIGADERGGELADIMEQTVHFPEDPSGKRNSSGQIYFCLTDRIPKKVVRFKQVWKWYYKDAKRSKSSGKGKPEFFAKTKNRIYIVFSKPGTPWYRRPNTAPWVDVMEKSYKWTVGKRESPEEAANEITKYLYEKMNGSWQRAPMYSEHRKGRFDLERFMKRIPNIGEVNCIDMSKALVTFANVLGCGLVYKQTSGFADKKLHRIAPFGIPPDGNLDIDYHAFCSLDKKVYDPTFKGCRKYTCIFLTPPDINNWGEYIIELLVDDSIKEPPPCDFIIGSLPDSE